MARIESSSTVDLPPDLKLYVKIGTTSERVLQMAFVRRLEGKPLSRSDLSMYHRKLGRIEKTANKMAIGNLNAAKRAILGSDWIIDSLTSIEDIKEGKEPEFWLRRKNEKPKFQPVSPEKKVVKDEENTVKSEKLKKIIATMQIKTLSLVLSLVERNQLDTANKDFMKFLELILSALNPSYELDRVLGKAKREEFFAQIFKKTLPDLLEKARENLTLLTLDEKTVIDYWKKLAEKGYSIETLTDIVLNHFGITIQEPTHKITTFSPAPESPKA